MVAQVVDPDGTVKENFMNKSDRALLDGMYEVSALGRPGLEFLRVDHPK